MDDDRIVDRPAPGTKMEQPQTGVGAVVVRSYPGAVLDWAEGVVLVGKRYRCATCGTEVLVTRGGASAVVCHGAAMPVVEPRPLPSSD